MCRRRTRASAAWSVAAGAGRALTAQQAPPPPLVTSQEILDGLTADGSRWLTFGGNYTNHRHSPLTQITPANVNRLVPQWTFQTGTLGNFETTSLLRDNVLYVTGPQNVAWALDARTGRQIWRYRRELPATGLTACCGLVNRGFGVLGDKLFMTTLDAHLLALDMKTGAIVWDATLEDYKIGYASTIAPLVVKDKVIVGVAGGEFGIRGFIDAYDAQTGKRAWRFYTIPGPGEPGNDTWAGDSWKIGGAGVWVTGAYDPEQNLVFYGTGNPGPDYHSESREGDNLYSGSLVALDADTGKLRWHYQFTPHDVHDWDATEVPILADLTIGGQPRKVVMFANRNGFYYTLDRTNGKVIVAKPFVTTTWAKEIDARWPADAAARPHAGREGRDHLSRHHRRHQLLAADLRSAARGRSSSTRAKPARPTTRGSPSTCRASASPAARGQRVARVPTCRCTARCAPSIRRPASASGSSAT